MLEVAAVLAWWAAPGRAWQALALCLAAEGRFVDEEPLRHALAWALVKEARDVDRIADRVRPWLEEQLIAAPDELDIAEAVVESVRGSRAERAYFRLNKPIVAERYPRLGSRQRFAHLRASMLWNVAERYGCELTGELKALAQG